MACLFGDTNCGKSILAVQIADEIARMGHKVLYVDMELSSAQFRSRYTDEITGATYDFSGNLRRAEVRPCNLIRWSDEALLYDIETAANDAKCSVVIIDSITYLRGNMERGKVASRLMSQLRELKIRNEWSVLLVAHTPKRPSNAAITLNDIAGSRILPMSFNSIFAIGAVNNADSLRYIIQLKCEECEFVNGADNVVVGSILKDGPWLHFSAEYTATEADILFATGSPANARVLELWKRGLRQQDIADIITREGIPMKQYQVSRILKSYKLKR